MTIGHICHRIKFRMHRTVSLGYNTCVNRDLCRSKKTYVNQKRPNKRDQLVNTQTFVLHFDLHAPCSLLHDTCVKWYPCTPKETYKTDLQEDTHPWKHINLCHPFRSACISQRCATNYWQLKASYGSFTPASYGSFTPCSRRGPSWIKRDGSREIHPLVSCASWTRRSIATDVVKAVEVEGSTRGCISLDASLTKCTFVIWNAHLWYDMHICDMRCTCASHITNVHVISQMCIPCHKCACHITNVHSMSQMCIPCHKCACHSVSQARHKTHRIP